MCGLNTSWGGGGGGRGRQVELIARAFAAAMELKPDVIQSSESQSNLLQSNYEKKLKEPRIPDPKTVRENAVVNVTKWPQITLGVGT